MVLVPWGPRGLYLRETMKGAVRMDVGYPHRCWIYPSSMSLRFSCPLRAAASATAPSGPMLLPPMSRFFSALHRAREGASYKHTEKKRVRHAEDQRRRGSDMLRIRVTNRLASPARRRGSDMLRIKVINRLTSPARAQVNSRMCSQCSAVLRAICSWHFTVQHTMKIRCRDAYGLGNGGCGAPFSRPRLRGHSCTS